MNGEFPHFPPSSSLAIYALKLVPGHWDVLRPQCLEEWREVHQQFELVAFKFLKLIKINSVNFSYFFFLLVDFSNFGEVLSISSAFSPVVGNKMVVDLSMDSTLKISQNKFKNAKNSNSLFPLKNSKSSTSGGIRTFGTHFIFLLFRWSSPLFPFKLWNFLCWRCQILFDSFIFLVIV